MTAPASPSILSQKQRRRLFRLFRDEIIAWLCCLRTLISGEQPTSEFLIAVEPLPDNFPFYVDAIRRRFPIADKRRPDRRVVFDVELEFRVRDVTSEPMVWVLRMTPDWGSTQGIHEPSLSDHPQVSFLGIFEIPLSAIEDAHRTFAIDSDLVLEGISCSVANGECVYLLSEISGWPTRSPLSAQNASEPQAHKAFFLCTRNRLEDASDVSIVSGARQPERFTKIKSVGETVPLKPCAICSALLPRDGPRVCSTHSYSPTWSTGYEQRPGWVAQC